MRIFKNVRRAIWIVGRLVSVKVLELVVEYQEKGDKRVCEDHTSQKDQDLLADG